MDGDTSGGNDTLIGGASAFNVLYGDANEMHDAARGGNDTLIGGDGAFINSLIGDAGTMDGDSRGGNDTLIGGAGRSRPAMSSGDAFTFNNARGGNDHLTGGDNSLNVLIGDARIAGTPRRQRPSDRRATGSAQHPDRRRLLHVRQRPRRQ